MKHFARKTNNNLIKGEMKEFILLYSFQCSYKTNYMFCIDHDDLRVSVERD